MCSYNVLIFFGTIESFGGEIASFFIMGFCKNITFCFVFFIICIVCTSCYGVCNTDNIGIGFALVQVSRLLVTENWRKHLPNF